jgi:hypothetical protein
LSEEKSITYDPSTSDPTEAQLESIGKMGFDDLSAEDLATPELVKFLLLNQRNLLLQYKEASKEIEKLKEQKDGLLEIKETLNVDLAKKEAYKEIAWLEILISVVSGFAINMLVIDTSDGTGWIMLILSISMLLITRFRLKN